MKVSFWRITVSLCALLAFWLAFCAPAMAQAGDPSGPQYSQYVDCSAAEAGVQGCHGAIDVYGGVEAAVENTGRGTETLNGALDGVRNLHDADAMSETIRLLNGGWRMLTLAAIPSRLRAGSMRVCFRRRKKIDVATEVDNTPDITL